MMRRWWTGTWCLAAAVLGAAAKPGLPWDLNHLSNLLPQGSSQLLTQVTSRSSSTLRFVSVVSRHGSRAPLYTYPSDPYPFTDVTFWPDGPEHMTKYGKQQTFQIGQRLRERYKGFVSANFFPNETWMEANDNPRDFETAACILAGLYPPVGFQLWNPAILWQPIQIHTNVDDFVTFLNEGVCPGYRTEAFTTLARVSADWSKMYGTLLEYLSKHIGTRVSSPTTVVFIYDALTMDQENGYPLPEWSKAVFPEKLRTVYANVFDAMFTGSPTLMRVGAGPVLNRIREQLNAKAKGTLVPNLKVNILAAHDATVRVILNGLGIYRPRVIETSAYLVFELHELPAGYFLQLSFYRDSTALTPDIFNITSCGPLCPLDQFNKIVDELYTPDWKSFCNASQAKPEVDSRKLVLLP